MNSSGVVYIAAGEKYIRAAMRSATTVLKHCPDLPIHLFADWQNHGFVFDRSTYPFSSVTTIQNPHRRSKVDFFTESPFDWTLYLDTDTALQSDIREMFRLMERFDIAMTHAQHRHVRTKRAIWRLQLPTAFPPYNTGVILYRKTPEVLRFLGQWQTEFHRNAGLFRQDQVTMCELLWLSELRLATLPPEYNVRYIKYHFLWSRSEATTKIFHLRRYHVGWFAWVFRPLGKMQVRAVRRLGRSGIAEWWRRRGGAK